MPVTFWKAEANSDVHLMINQAMLNWHKELNQYKVKVGVIFAYSDNVEKPAVKHGGYPAIASVRLVTGKDRVIKDFEVEMLVDASAWKSLSSESKLAVIDHELAHVSLKKKKVKKSKDKDKDKEAVSEKQHEDAEEEVVLDDHNRPVLKLKKGDWNVGDGFSDVVSRHGKNAIEYLNIKSAEKMAADAMDAES